MELSSSWLARAYKKAIQETNEEISAYSALGVEDAYVDPYSLITKLDNHLYLTL